MSEFRWPGPTHRTSVVGSTGTGKSFFAVNLLSTRNINDRPWTIFDPKNDQLIGELPTQDLPVGSSPPKAPGLYRINPIPDLHDEWIERYMWEMWKQEDHGFYIDEGYMISRHSNSLKALLTQGRSKHIEMIMLSQRPAWCHPMMFSESDFLSIFRLNKLEDRQRMQSNSSVNVMKRLPEYHSYWYDVGRDNGFVMKPVPRKDVLIKSFDRFIKRKVTVI